MNKKVYFDDVKKNEDTNAWVSGSMRYQEEDDNGVVIDPSKVAARTMYSKEIFALNDGSKTEEQIAQAYADSLNGVVVVDAEVPPVVVE